MRNMRKMRYRSPGARTRPWKPPQSRSRRGRNRGRHQGQGDGLLRVAVAVVRCHNRPDLCNGWPAVRRGVLGGGNHGGGVLG
eukprot:13503518-Heterocapsa_arctica.AAC.1